MCVLCSQTDDLLSGLVGWDVCLVFSDRRPAIGSCRAGMCVLCSQTGDLLSGLVGWDVCLVFSDRNLLSSLGCVSCFLRPATCFRVL